MSEKVTLAQLKRMRQEAFSRGDAKEMNRLELAISMRAGKYPKDRRHNK